MNKIIVTKKKVKKKECQLNAIERNQFGCQLECIAGHDCIYYHGLPPTPEKGGKK